MTKILIQLYERYALSIWESMLHIGKASTDRPELSHLAWWKYGGGEELYNELVHDILDLKLPGFRTGPMPTQALGWFKEPVASPEDLRGMSYRTVGLAADMMEEFGASVTIMGGGDIVPAIDRGLLDGAEFNNPSPDRLLGFPDVSKTWMLRSYHQDCESLYPFKSVIPICGALLTLQGFAEVTRCIMCLRSGKWPEGWSGGCAGTATAWPSTN